MDKVAAMVDKHEKTKMSAISDFAAQASKYVLAGLAVYLGIAFTAGGAHRVRKDLEIVKVCTPFFLHLSVLFMRRYLVGTDARCLVLSLFAPASLCVCVCVC